MIFHFQLPAAVLQALDIHACSISTCLLTRCNLSVHAACQSQHALLCTLLKAGHPVQSGDAEKDKLRASLGSAILAERPNVKVSHSQLHCPCINSRMDCRTQAPAE